MSEKRICPYSKKDCRFNCNLEAEYCFDMRIACQKEIRKGHEKFGKVGYLEEDSPSLEEQGDFINYKKNMAAVKPHAKLHNKVYFQGIDKRKLNPSIEDNEEAKQMANELQFQNALRYKNSPKPTPF
ncbi:MAG: hypothetical protein LEGION0398_MBIBDBAK_00892 [Legionellaceae bacterium]